MSNFPTPSQPIHRLYVLDFGLFQVHANDRIIGITGYLLQTQSGQNILIDTGFPAQYADDPQAATLADGLQSFGRVLELTPEHLPPAQLAKLDLSPSDIDMLIMTHTDIDHVGGIADFPHAPLVISKAERDLPRPRYFGQRQPMEWPENVTYQVVDEDVEIVPGVVLLQTPGHAPGQMSVLVTLPETGPVLLTGDAISRPAEIDEKFAGSWDEELAQASAARLMAIADELDAFIIYGHDPAQWGTLRKAPEGYR